jgi:hypothetical protein
MTTEAGSSRFSLLMTPLVVDAAFVKNGAGGEARQVGRLAKTVGLDANASYTFRVILGSDEAGVLAPDDALRAASGNGIAPLVEAEAGASSWGDLSLVSNAAWFGAAELEDWNDANKAGADKPHTTRGTAEYMLPTLAAGEEATAHFKMEYAPFGLADNASWTAAPGNAAPVWTIRNGLNDDPQTDATDFAHYGLVGTANANGALSVAVVNPAAALGAGLYEDGNPWPALSFTTPAAGDLEAALNYLDDAGTAGKYGAYTIRLSVDPTLPVYPGAKITLGGIPSANSYAAIKQTRIIIEGTTGAAVIMPLTTALWTQLDGNTVSNGSGIAQELVKSAASGSTEWVVPWDDDYLIELNGAESGAGYGSSKSGKGGTIKGTIHLTQGDIYEINVGGVGANGKADAYGQNVAAAGGSNGGGNSSSGSGIAGGGGGATDIRTPGGDWTTRMMVAGGGGAAAKVGAGGAVDGGNGGNGNGGFGGDGYDYRSQGYSKGGTLTTGAENGVGSNGRVSPTGGVGEAGGGGGGGYRGGLGGASSSGGGGSSWANTSAGMFFDVTPAANGAGAHTGNGSVRIIALMRQ